MQTYFHFRFRDIVRWLCVCAVANVPFGSGQTSFAHKQHIHQYIVKEAYQLLSTQLGGDITGMVSHVGGLEPSYAGDYAWQRPYLTTGAWREDTEDPVFGYRISNLLNNYSLVSISHFWDADQGDLTINSFRVNPLPGIVFNIGPYENSYDKLRRYAQGGWILWFPDTIIVERVSNGHLLLLAPLSTTPPTPFGVPVSYQSLTAFYQTRLITLRADVTGAYVVFDINDQTVITGSLPIDILVAPDMRDRITWETLGRMCHLLADLSVPTHTRRDEHGLDPDVYEEAIGGPTLPYTVWNSSNAGPIVNPFTPDGDPLHYLMYTMHQQSNHFGSIGPYEGVGNDVTGGEGRSHELAFLATLNLSSFGLPTHPQGPWTTTTLENIRDRTFPYAIRSTAGLLYWFATEAQLIGPTRIWDETTGVPSGYALAQNYPNPFNPATVISYDLPVASHVLLRIHDMLGREVAVLVDEVQDAGNIAVEWDASGLPSGTYFYRIQAGTFVDVKKLLMIK